MMEITKKDLEAIQELLRVSGIISQEISIGLRPSLLLRKQLAESVKAVTDLKLVEKELI